eukprot:TRINITY_DN5466_c0_g1_i2.p1 TRINITY_DN5466_c0_g1~~TRINITY_DN5466_c0_g1_i2.p1  ORF type:complete len:161 (+),score=17.71 TRINITY_DN5466_c0_g1_i2:262-744(+)
MVGLDGAGKTSIVTQLQLGQAVAVPTIGCTIQNVQHNNLQFTMWDMGGQDKVRHLWAHYYHLTQAIIFVVDSSDRERLPEALGEVGRLFVEEQLGAAPFLLFLNKQDVAGSVSVEEMRARLENVNGHPIFIQPCCALTGEGLRVGLDWLASAIRDSIRPS